MMKKQRYIFLFAFLLLSCDKDDGNGDEINYNFYTGATIIVNELDFATIASGGNLVFEYSFTADDEPNIADDEYAERIIFEVPAGVSEFAFTDSDLVTIKPYFDKYCFCPIDGSLPIAEGTITGKQISSTVWEISITVSFQDFQLETRNISKRFTLATRS